MVTLNRLAAAAGVGLLIPFLYACHKAPGPAGGASGSAAPAGAEALFTANCAKCHSINGAGGKRAPDLSHTGAESQHTADWLAAFIKDPGATKPGTRMPAFGGRLSDADIKSLADYLAGLK